VRPAEADSLEFVEEFLAGCEEFPNPFALQEWCAVHAPPGCAAEFGVGFAASLERISKHRYTYGFDSFEGLPEDWRVGFPKGTFGGAPIPHIANTQIIVGEFADTIPKFVESRFMWTPPRLGFVHIDCDLYMSTVSALQVAPLLVPDALILFDEFFGWPGWQAPGRGEYAALMDSGIVFEFVAYSGEAVCVRVKGV
jgi:hypothetical protein